MLNKMRDDGKNQKALFWIALFGGLIGSEYFYLNRKKLGLIKLLISWFGALFVTVVWMVYGSIPTLPANFDFNNILIPSIIGGLFLIFTFIWTLFNTFLIATGRFKDEQQKQVGSWSGTKESFVKNLLDL